MRRYFLVLLALCSFAAPLPAQAGWLEFFFPTLAPKPYDPTQTMRAEFAPPPQGDAAADANTAPAKVTLPEDHIPLDRAHKDNDELGQWLMMALAESLTFSQGDINAVLTKTRFYFDDAGYAQYTAFLRESAIQQSLQSGRYTVHAFAQEKPLMLNQGAVDGRYRWLLEIPVMVSFIERGAKDYKKIKPVNKNFIFLVQIGRLPPKEGHSAVVIERLTLKGAAPKAP